MSHSISARNPHEPVEIAFLHFSFNELERSYVFYTLLGAGELNGGVSGIGEGKLLPKQTIDHALSEYLAAGHLLNGDPSTVQPEIEFLRSCSQHDAVFIWFS